MELERLPGCLAALLTRTLLTRLLFSLLARTLSATPLLLAAALLARLLRLLTRLRILLVWVLLVGIGHLTTPRGFCRGLCPNLNQLREPDRVSGKGRKKAETPAGEFAGNLARICRMFGGRGTYADANPIRSLHET